MAVVCPECGGGFDKGDVGSYFVEDPEARLLIVQWLSVLALVVNLVVIVGIMGFGFYKMAKPNSISYALFDNLYTGFKFIYSASFLIGITCVFWGMCRAIRINRLARMMFLSELLLGLLTVWYYVEYVVLI